LIKFKITSQKNLIIVIQQTTDLIPHRIKYMRMIKGDVME